MKKKFIASVVRTSKKPTIALPWERGPRRMAFIAERNAQQVPLRRSA